MTPPVRIALIGAAGRMGLEIARLVSTQTNAVIGAAIEYAGSSLIGADMGELAGTGPSNVFIGFDIASACDSFDVIIDIGTNRGQQRM